MSNNWIFRRPPRIVRKPNPNWRQLWPTTFVAVGLATEADTAFSVTAEGGLPEVVLAIETSTAFSVGLAKDKAVGLAEEFDFSLDAVPAGLGAPAGLSEEASTSLPAIADKGYDVGLPTETGSALTVAPMKELDAIKGIEVDEALAAIVGISPILDIVTETDSGLPLNVANTKTPNIAPEINTALQVLFDAKLFVGLPEEVSSALPATPFSRGLVEPAIEIDVSLPAQAHRSTLVGQTTETDSAFTVTVDTVQVPRDLGWEDDDVTWGGVEIGSKDFAPVYVTDLDFKILGYDASSALDAYIERRAVLSERGAIVLGTAIWPDIQGPTGQPILVSMGAHDTPDGSIDWEGPYAFYIGQDQFVDFAVSGKYLATRFEGAGVSAWTLQSYDVEYEVVGRH